MTRKDFQAIADILKATKPIEANMGMSAQWRAMCERFADYLINTNERFNRGKFLAACGYQS